MSEKEYNELKRIFFIKCKELEEISTIILQYENLKNDEPQQNAEKIESSVEESSGD